jgi:hypothetical protein
MSEDNPIVERLAANAEWIVDVLVRPCAIPVKGNRKALDAKF